MREVSIWLVIALVAVLLVLVLLAALLVFSFQRARILLTAVRKPLDRCLEDVGLAADEVRFPSPRGTLAAWYVAPLNGCVLLCCHGINDNRGQWIKPVARLRERWGYGALLFDFSGHGESEGRLVSYGAGEIQDVRAALDYLRSRGDVDMSRIGILGYSLGAITATLAAAQMPELRCLVIESGFADLKRDISALFQRFTGLPPFPFALLVIWFAERISGLKLADIRPASVIGRVSPRPVFIIADLDDDLANEPYDGEQLFANAGEPKQLWQVADCGHVKAFEIFPDEWVCRVGSFLDRSLMSVPAPLAPVTETSTRPE